MFDQVGVGNPDSGHCLLRWEKEPQLCGCHLRLWIPYTGRGNMKHRVGRGLVVGLVLGVPRESGIRTGGGAVLVLG